MNFSSIWSAFGILFKLMAYEKESGIKRQLELRPNTEKQDLLAHLFTKYGSDKAFKHGYDRWYSDFLGQISESECVILEFGIGTNDITLPSNMGIEGKAGASLRAFRDFTTKPILIGVDVDSKSLFSENRIKTFLGDQRHLDKLRNVMKNVEQLNLPLALVVIDGLHEPHADARSAYAVLSVLAGKGRIYIEDISPQILIQLYWKMFCLILKRKGFTSEKYLGNSGSILLMLEKK